MHWRLKLDVPHDLEIEPGIQVAAHCRDFRPEAGGLQNTFRDPVTGVVMLRPSFLWRSWYDYAKPLSQFRHTSGFWQEVKRGADLTAAFTNVRAQSAGFLLIELAVDAAIMAIESSLEFADTLRWALDTKFTLTYDEGFSLHINALSDEMSRKNNWLYLQWDDIGIHLSAQGAARIYRYERGNLQQTPTHVYEFTFCSPAELKSKNSVFTLIPVPTLGLLFYHSLATPLAAVRAGNAEMAMGRGHLIPWRTRTLGDGDGTLFDASPLRIGINPYQKYVLSFASIRYPSSGSFTDAPFDFGFAPGTQAPAAAPILLKANSIWGGGACELRKGDNSAAWTLGDRSARVKTTLTCTDGVHTPFLYGYGVSRDPIRATRQTTALTAAEVLRLEWSQNSAGEMEGEADLIVEGLQIERIAERGDTTFLLEKSANGTDWSVHLGGIATEWRLSAQADMAGRWYYRARCRLVGMQELLRERRMLTRTAFDGLTLKDALNVCMRVGGFPPIALSPPDFDNIRIPPPVDGNQWRWSPSEGDDLWEVIQKLLLLGRAQLREYALYYDWSAQAWTVALRNRDEGTVWTLVPRTSQHDPASRSLKISSLEVEPAPPEANVLVFAGADRPDNAGERVINSVTNPASVSDPNSPHYLGRVKTAAYVSRELSEQGEVNKMLRRLGEVMLYRSVTARAELPYYHDALTVNSRIRVMGMNDAERIERMWVKRLSVVITGGNMGGMHGTPGYQEQTTLEMESIWENDVR